MYTKSNAATLPRATTATLVNHKQKNYYEQFDKNISINVRSKHHDDVINDDGVNDDDDNNNNNINNDDNVDNLNRIFRCGRNDVCIDKKHDNDLKDVRPTYGAYINNTIPRGPYLQYKFNDHQSCLTLLKDNKRQNCQIENLRKEFKGLPRAKLSTTNLNIEQLETGTETSITIKRYNRKHLNNGLHQHQQQKQQQQQQHKQPEQHPYLSPDGTQTIGRYTFNNNYSNNPNKSQGLYNNVHLHKIKSNSFDDPFEKPTTEITAAGVTAIENQKYKHNEYEEIFITSKPNVNTNNTNRNNHNNDPIILEKIKFNTISNATSKQYRYLQQQYQQQQQHYNIGKQEPNENYYNIGNHNNNNNNTRADIKYNHTTEQQNIRNDFPEKYQSHNNNNNIENTKMSLNQKHHHHKQKYKYDDLFPSPNNSNQNRKVNHGQCYQTSRSIRNHQMSSLNGCGNLINVSGSVKSVNQLNYVTLSDVLEAKPNGLSQMEGWALLCQSVQALQDLFLADTPSTTRILPLVNPMSLQITSRGRVALNIIPVGHLEHYTDNNLTYFNIMSYLSPEYLNCAGKKITFSESDIEKMWIYSLGITLHRTITSNNRLITGSNTICTETIVQLKNNNNNNNIPVTGLKVIKRPSITTTVPNDYKQLSSNRNTNTNNHIENNNINELITNSNDAITRATSSAPVYTSYNQQHRLSTSLDHVLSSMCERNLHHRASLMYLLDVISEYFRSHHQIKPFSHIVMDIFKNVIISNSNKEVNNQNEVKENLCKKESIDEQPTSETDSGRSSAHGDKEIYTTNREATQNEYNDVKMSMNYQQQNRCPEEKMHPDVGTGLRVNKHIDQDKFNSLPNKKYTQHNNVIGGMADAKIEKVEKLIQQPVKLHVIRRRGDILRKRDLKRRNTIEVNLIDLQKAKDSMESEILQTDKSKSTNFIDKFGKLSLFDYNKKFIDNSITNGQSMPDLVTAKPTTLPNLKIRRQKANENVYKSENNINHRSSLVVQKGPEFIVKSHLPAKEIDITDSKCQHRRIVSVLLLNGHRLDITCNPTTTTAQQIFECVINSENYIENFFLGLCALIGGDFIFLPHDLKIYKVAPQVWINVDRKSTISVNSVFTLFLRIKFFLPTLRGVSSLESRHLLYLQLRKSILEGQVLCTDEDLVTLGGLALQAEVGEYAENMKNIDYFTISQYLPEGVYERNNSIINYIRNSHLCKKGLHRMEAEHNFIRQLQEMKEYGQHLYSAIWMADDNICYNVYIALSLNGIAIFQRNSSLPTEINDKLQIIKKKYKPVIHNSKISYQRKLYINFDWLEIENLCYSKHILCIAVRRNESLCSKNNNHNKNRIKYKLKMDDRKSYFAFNLASEHHKFYMKLRNSFVSLKTIASELNIQLNNKYLINDEITLIAKASQTTQLINEKQLMINDKKKLNDKNEKLVKASSTIKGLSVRNIKKSMLNDNKLIKLREKFLKRSKSSVEIVNKCDLNDNNNHNEIITIINTKEENQNKENECPKYSPVSTLSSGSGISSLGNRHQQSHETQQTHQQKIYSPNRNRVKMGTRVFSSQFLNKSFDNIYDNPLDICRYDLNDSFNNFDTNLNENLNKHEESNDDCLSLKSTSIGSIYLSERNCAKLTDTSDHNDAYVIHSSIKSFNINYNNNFSLENETVSDSLLEKFNNISCSINNNKMNDRIIKRLRIIKEIINNNNSNNNNPDNNNIDNNNKKKKLKNHDDRKLMKNDLLKRFKANMLSRSQESILVYDKIKKFALKLNEKDKEKDDNDNENVCNYTLGISIVQGSDNNVYVKDLVESGPGENAGVHIGDQILAVDGVSLLNKPYTESLIILQSTGRIVDLIVSQIYNNNSLNKTLISNNKEETFSKFSKNDNKLEKTLNYDELGETNEVKSLTLQQVIDNNDDEDYNNDDSDNVDGCINMLTPSKSMPDLPKVVGILPKYINNKNYQSYNNINNIKINNNNNNYKNNNICNNNNNCNNKKKTAIPRSLGLTRKYIGPVKYPVTPGKGTTTLLKTTYGHIGKQHNLSLLADSDDEQVFI